MSRVALTLLLVAQGVLESPCASAIDFVREVRPILQKHCYACHGNDKQKSNLRLDIKSEAFRGGESYGPAIVAGKPEESPLLKFLNDEKADLKMPPDGQRLSHEEISTLTKWVHDGAVWPEGADLGKLVDKRDHWSFNPFTTPQPPTTRNNAWPRGDIDRFVLSRLEAEGMRPSAEASRLTWLRRASFDLIGLPPTPEQVQLFLEDQRDDAYERVVDELLRSPRYGERWAQHWLDVVRFADTHGFEVNTERPNAWPYRDYVVQAFNNDTPYDQFIREQIAGDALGQDAATGFLVTASVLLPGQIGKDEPSKRLARQDSLDEIVINIGQTFLGVSLGCARCHDHKFDPISAREYYSMQAFVAGVEYADRELRTPAAEARKTQSKQLREQIAEVEKKLTTLAPRAKSGVEREAVNARMNIDRFSAMKAKRLRFIVQETNNREPCLDEVEVFDAAGTNVARSNLGTTVTTSGSKNSAKVHELPFVHDGVYGNSSSWMSSDVGKGWLEFEFKSQVTIDRVVWSRDRSGRFNDRLPTRYVIEVADDLGEWQIVADSSDRQKHDPSRKVSNAFSTAGLDEVDKKVAEHLLSEKLRFEQKLALADSGQKAFAGSFRTPDVIHLLNRGDPEQPKDKVTAAVPVAFGSLELPAEATEQERRLALANWIAEEQNPMTARVMVNRIWQGHFGTGLVETASDFGRTGTKPSHPELLDWLAKEFMRCGWSIKKMHRQIVLSATYRQSSQHNDAADSKDADVRLLWRFPSRRLESEAIRDSMLAVSGQLNLQMGGRGFNLFDKRGGLSGFIPVETFPQDGLRRMIYAHKVRREREAVFGAFDCPDAGQSTARRRESTTPIQALNLFNSRFTIDQSQAFAARVQNETGDDVNRQIERSYILALARLPNDEETADAVSVVQSHGLNTLCRALFNSNEFLFVP